MPLNKTRLGRSVEGWDDPITASIIRLMGAQKKNKTKPPHNLDGKGHPKRKKKEAAKST